MSFNLTKIQQLVKTKFLDFYDWLKINEKDIVLVVGVVLIALISFGAGRLTVPRGATEPLTIENAVGDSFADFKVNTVDSGINLPASPTAAISNTTQSALNELNLTQGKFVASKNSKYYHWPWSPSGKRIKAENQIWFNSEEEAQVAGFGRSSNFLQYAPAGYE